MNDSHTEPGTFGANANHPGGGVALAGPVLDLVQPFQVETPGGSAVRGRFTRLGPVLDDILSRHDYPDPVARLLAEMVTLAATMAAALKYEGVFSLQSKGDGAISMMVADITSTGEVRGYAQYDSDKLAHASQAIGPVVPRFLGSGHLAFTVDQGDHAERYQGIVELRGDHFSDCVDHYFRQSEQLDVWLKVAVDRPQAEASSEAPPPWRAGVFMLQRIPDNDGRGGIDMASEDDWQHALALAKTLTEIEMLDPALTPPKLLRRLFHEHGVRIYEPRPVAQGCRCSRDRVVGVLRMLSEEELSEMYVDDAIEVRCEFCAAGYEFSRQEVASLRSSSETPPA